MSHVVVLGAGIIGMTTAYYLSRAGHRVTVIERNAHAGLETSYANGGQLSYSYVAPLADTEADRRADQAARAGHRVLLLWIKAALNAVAAGLLTAEEVFLPHMEGSDGRTVAEVALPRLRDLLTGAPASRLLPQGDTDAR